MQSRDKLPTKKRKKNVFSFTAKCYLRITRREREGEKKEDMKKERKKKEKEEGTKKEIERKSTKRSKEYVQKRKEEK